MLPAVTFLVLAAVPIWAPLVSTGARNTAAAAAGLGLAPALAALLLGENLPTALCAGIAATGFFLLVSGVAAGTTRLSGRAAAGGAVAGLFGVLLLCSFHIGDPFIEWAGAGKACSSALTVLHAANPASGVVGHALDIDWLRLPIMYSGFPGTTTDGLSSAQYYHWAYFPWWGTALLHGAVGGALLAGTFRGQRLRWSAE